MIKLVNFNEIFEDFMNNWYKENSKKFVNADQMEDAAADVYLEWLKSPNVNLGGVAPSNYFDEVKSGRELVKLLEEYAKREDGIPDILCDAIIDRKDTEKPLFEIVQATENSEVLMTSINLLNELQSKMPLQFYISAIVRRTYNIEVLDLMAEILCFYPDEVKEDILMEFEDCDDVSKAEFIQVLSNCQKDDRIFEILKEEFLKAEDVSILAGYIGKYGDDRAILMLNEKIKQEKINYVEYIELKSAIESLGGVVSVEKDFSDDKMYKVLKNIQ